MSDATDWAQCDKLFAENSVVITLRKSSLLFALSACAVDDAGDLSSYNTETLRLHEAGFDAFLTGLCLVNMTNYLGQFVLLFSGVVNNYLCV